MLPPELADDACSLRPYVDRLCVTVEVPFSSALEAGEPAFYRSVIPGRERFTYGQVERILSGRETAASELAAALRLAEEVATNLRRRRYSRGALRIETPELVFAFDDRGGVERAWTEAEPHAHMLVEELMILANECVAALLAGRRREALFRVHERPDHAVGAAAPREARRPRRADAARARSGSARPLGRGRLAAVAERVMTYVRRSSRGTEAFPALVLRSLKQARYHPENLGHSGLSTAYCHFTSPIRRYPDLVVHRALLRELGAGDAPAPDGLDDLAEHTSARERATAQLEPRGRALPRMAPRDPAA